MTTETVIHRPELNPRGLQELPSRPMTSISTETVTHHTPQAPKKPLVKALDFLKPTVYKPEGDETPSASKRILDTPSLARLRKSLKEKKTEKTNFPPPGRQTIHVVDGKSGTTIRANVPTYRLMDVSARAREALESCPRTNRFKVYGKYKRASMCGVLEALVYHQPIPISGKILMHNLFTYEACLRLGMANDSIELRPLVAAINKEISTGRIDNELMAFVMSLGPEDRVFKHTANVLCHQRFTKSVVDVKEFARMVARKPAMQKAITQIDREHEARREAFRARKQAGPGRDTGDESDKFGSQTKKVVGGRIVETMLGKAHLDTSGCSPRQPN
ncbi:hypothetical protein N0V86_007342 [Didymella sp. IMI 355093]|nr:hypothetical protein N0V86_007342 [Didymella sp. IMI 355093]